MIILSLLETRTVVQTGRRQAFGALAKNGQQHAVMQRTVIFKREKEGEREREHQFIRSGGLIEKQLPRGNHVTSSLYSERTLFGLSCGTGGIYLLRTSSRYIRTNNELNRNVYHVR